MLALAVSAYADVPCAIKFFPVAAHFKAELAVRKTPLGAFTPQIFMAHDPARSDPNRVGTRDRYGRQLPPCIVMPRGENLQAWLDRAETDRFQAVSVRAPLALCCVLCMLRRSAMELHLSACSYVLCRPACLLMAGRFCRCEDMGYDVRMQLVSLACILCMFDVQSGSARCALLRLQLCALTS